ncbi:MAG: hypothetical protein GY913_08150 [Proteobacteria bacterium]|nr:hypothetical protein [Pseudomonadota bacterium]MCP4916883.1 hypothetical protein [Pseudomonadota bacterium]
MKRTLSIAAALTVLVACGKKHAGTYEVAEATGTADNAELMKAGAEALWEQRGDVAKLEQALASYEQIVAADPTDRDSYERLVRGYYFLGDGHYTEIEKKEAAWDKSMIWGKRCLALNTEFTALLEKGDEDEATAAAALGPEDMACMYWLASATGKWGRIQGLATLLKEKDKIYAWMTVLDENDPDYYYTASTRYFGAYYAALPSFAGQDLDQSKVKFEEAIAAHPDHLGNRVLICEYWGVKTQTREICETELNYVINADPAVIPELQPEQEAEQRKAQALLDQMDDLFAE